VDGHQPGPAAQTPERSIQDVEGERPADVPDHDGFGLMLRELEIREVLFGGFGQQEEHATDLVLGQPASGSHWSGEDFPRVRIQASLGQ
jgi:hypothetical protein